MDSKILVQIKENLLAEKARLEDELNRFTIKDEAVADNYKSEFPKYGDSEDENAAEVADYTDNLSIEHALEKQLKDVNKALANVESGSYGICKHCGQPIEEQRLLARPVSSSCVACKKALKGEQ